MSVRIRLARMGRRHRPFYRINAVDGRTPRDGKILEKLGHYDPIEKDVDKQIVLDLEKTKAWLDKGAVPSDTVINILKKRGVTCSYMEAKAARREKSKAIARKKGILFTEAEKVAAKKAAETAAAEAEAKAAEAQAAAKAKAAEAESAAKAKAAEAEAKAAEAEKTE